jgi:hypothetical protein
MHRRYLRFFLGIVRAYLVTVNGTLAFELIYAAQCEDNEIALNCLDGLRDEIIDENNGKSPSTHLVLIVDDLLWWADYSSGAFSSARRGR